MDPMQLCLSKGLVLPNPTFDDIATYSCFLILLLPNNEMSQKSLCYSQSTERSASENSRIAEPLTDDYESYKKHEDDSISVVKRSFQSSHHDIHKCDQFPIEPSSDEIRLLKGEILVLNKALEMEIEKRENAEEKCLRLERLVNVLQRKVNGQNVGISV
ncbi:UNVERIFIED_CONTAM: hypothetical protein NCL1_47317 [Trichonephila clavipes]